MNRTRLTDEQLQEVVARLRKNYCYDGDKGLLVNRKTGKELKGYKHTDGYLRVDFHLNGVRCVFFYHRLIWAYFHCRFPTMQLDHINGIKTDNKIGNLREATQTQNNLNMVHPWKPNKDSGYTGVCKHGRRWRIRVCDKLISLHDRHEAFLHLMMLGRRYDRY
jgi:hypothetical protein